jgi:hypothetical protein
VFRERTALRGQNDDLNGLHDLDGGNTGNLFRFVPLAVRYFVPNVPLRGFVPYLFRLVPPFSGWARRQPWRVQGYFILSGGHGGQGGQFPSIHFFLFLYRCLPFFPIGLEMTPLTRLTPLPSFRAK